MMQIPRIHLIEKRWEVKPNAENSSILESGFWKYIDAQTAERLIGGKIYFHYTQKDRSYASGRIVGYRHALDNERADSILFLFIQDDPADSQKAENPNGWKPTGKGGFGVHPYRQIIL